MSWVNEEIKHTDLGDTRLKKRLGNLLESLEDKPTTSIPTACKGWHETKAAYRFFANERIDDEKILVGHQKATCLRIASEPVALLIQDTTELDYSSHLSKADIGILNYEERRGCYLHPTIAVTLNRLCLGVVDAKFIHREILKHRSRCYKEHPIEEKETFRWLQSYQKANEIAQQCPNTLIVSISDREGDIYELFLEAEFALKHA